MSKPYFNVEAHAESASSSTTQLPDQIYDGSLQIDGLPSKTSESVLHAKGLLVTQVRMLTLCGLLKENL